jgi:hypothetical protein
MNLVSRLFAEVTQRCVRRGSHTGVAQLEKATLDYLAQRNRDPKPFLWTALISAKCWPRKPPL